MAKKKSTSEKDLKAKLKKVRAQLAAAEKSAKKWQTRAKAHRSDAKGLKAELTAVRRRLAKAEASAARWKDRAKAPAPEAPAQASAEALATAAPTPVAPAAPSAVPDDSWTVTRLRAEARARGVAGYSRKTKEQLLTDLQG